MLTSTPLRIALAIGLLSGLTHCDWPSPKAVESCTEVTLAKATIAKEADWVGIQPRLKRAAGKPANPAAGYLLQTVSVAADLEKVYLRIEASVPKPAGKDAGTATDLGPGTVCGNGTCEPGEQGKCSQDCPGGGNNCGDGVCEGGEESSCPSDCARPELRIFLKTTGERTGSIQVSQGGQGSGWQVNGYWNSDDEGSSQKNIVSGGSVTTTSDGIAAEVWISRKELGELASLYPTAGRCCTNNQGPGIDDEIGCVWFRLGAPSAQPDGSISDGKPSPCPGGGVVCNKLCCKAGEVCSKEETCCAPDCGNRTCGPDPICGSSCGTCAASATCSGEGLCLKAEPWISYNVGGVDQLDAIWGSSPQKIWAVGSGSSGGAIFEYLPATQSWFLTPAQTGGDLHGIHGRGTEVWAVGFGGVHYSNGTSWLSEGPKQSLTGVWASPSEVLAVGPNGKLLRRNAGGGWLDETPQTGTANALHAVWGTAATAWGIVGDRTILRWTGAAWNSADSAGVTESLHGISGFSSSDVWVVGSVGTVMHFDGSGWRRLKTGTTKTLYGVWATAEKEAWAVGESGTVLHLSSGNVTQVAAGTTADLRGVWASSPSDVWAVGGLNSGLTLHRP